MDEGKETESTTVVVVADKTPSILALIDERDKRIDVLHPVSSRRFENYFSSITINKITQRFAIDQKPLYDLHKKDLVHLSKLDNLETLIIKGSSCTKEDRTSFARDWNHNVNQLTRTLTAVSSSRLNNLVVRSFWIKNATQEIFALESFMNCLEKHSKTLQHVTFETKLVNSKTRACTIKKSLYENIKPDLRNLELMSLFVGGQFSTQTKPAQEICKSIYEAQIANPKFKNGFCDFSLLDNPLKTKSTPPRPGAGDVQTKKPCLNHIDTIELLLNGNKAGVINCGDLFEFNKSLRVLSLCASQKGPKASLNLEPEIINLDKLPTLLQVLRISGLNVSEEDASFVATQLPNLNLLELVGIGTDAGLGLAYKAFCQIMTSKCIENIVLADVFNKKSIDEYKNSEPNESSTEDCAVQDDEDESNDENNDDDILELLSPTKLNEFFKGNKYAIIHLSCNENQYEIYPHENIEPVEYFNSSRYPCFEHSLQFNYPMLMCKEPEKTQRTEDLTSSEDEDESESESESEESGSEEENDDEEGDEEEDDDADQDCDPNEVEQNESDEALGEVEAETDPEPNDVDMEDEGGFTDDIAINFIEEQDSYLADNDENDDEDDYDYENLATTDKELYNQLEEEINGMPEPESQTMKSETESELVEDEVVVENEEVTNVVNAFQVLQYGEYNKCELYPKSESDDEDDDESGESDDEAEEVMEQDDQDQDEEDEEMVDDEEIEEEGPNSIEELEVFDIDEMIHSDDDDDDL